MKTGFTIYCTRQIALRIINGIFDYDTLQVGANGHPCPLHLNPPSVADFPLGVGHLLS